jgi:hypothetical protein
MPPPGPQPGPYSAGKPARGPAGCPAGRRARANPAHRRTEERQRPCRRYGPAPSSQTANWGASGRWCAMAVRCQGAAGAGTLREVEGHRDGPCAAGGPARPYGPPGRRLCSLRVLLPHDSANMVHAWAIRRVSVNRADVPKSYQRLTGTALGAPTNRPRSDRSGPTRRPLRAPPGSWPRPDCDRSSFRGSIASPIGWTVRPLAVTGQDAPGRGGDQECSRPWQAPRQRHSSACVATDQSLGCVGAW